MKVDPEHIKHIRRTIRPCQAESYGTCPCGEKMQRVVWRADENPRCYPIRRES